jgi:thiol-disulfide isomerase/thioredoxin
MSLVYAGADKKQDAEKTLKKRPLLVLFFMEGCPHCEANKPAWDQAKKKMKGRARVAEIEASATPDSANVSGFPTMKYVDKTGNETVISGEKQSGDQILSELRVSRGGSRRRRTHRRHTRKLRHRTLRSYVAF